ncbi:MAG: ankyrin repeat domain-containing protein [Candidatus Saccharimonadales bacterium]
MHEQAPNPNDLMRQMDHALQYGTTESLAALIDEGISVDQTDFAGRTALMIKTATGKTAAVEMLLSRGANVNAIYEHHGRIPNTALDAARQTGHTEIAALLESLGAKTGKEIALEQVARES